MAACWKPHRLDVVRFTKDVEGRSPAPTSMVPVRRGAEGTVVVERPRGAGYKVEVTDLSTGNPTCFVDVEAGVLELVVRYLHPDSDA